MTIGGDGQKIRLGRDVGVKMGAKHFRKTSSSMGFNLIRKTQLGRDSVLIGGWERENRSSRSCLAALLSGEGESAPIN